MPRRAPIEWHFRMSMRNSGPCTIRIDVQRPKAQKVSQAPLQYLTCSILNNPNHTKPRKQQTRLFSFSLPGCFSFHYEFTLSSDRNPVCCASSHCIRPTSRLGLHTFPGADKGLQHHHLPRTRRQTNKGETTVRCECRYGQLSKHPLPSRQKLRSVAPSLLPFLSSPLRSHHT